VTMDEADEGGAAAERQRGSKKAAVAKDGSDSEGEDSASGDESSKGEKDVDMGDATKSDDDDEDNVENSSNNPTETENMKVDSNDESGSDGNAKESNGSGNNKSNKNSAKGDDKKGEGSSKSNGKDKESETKATKKDNSGEKNEKEPENPDDNYPLLVGTLAFSDRDNLRRHIIRGNWKYAKSHAVPPQPFELIRTIPPEEELKELPKDGEFAGSFNVQHQVKTSKGKLKLKNRAVPENGVKLKFTPKEGDDGEEDVFSVKGKGNNEFGVFELFGTATKNSGDDDPTYSVSVRKKYVGAPAGDAAASTKTKGDKKDKKRKHAEASGDDEDEGKPPPTELPTEGVCLRGKLARNTSDELSLDNTAVHRITGLWAMKPSIIDDAPGTCEKFEYEHKCSGDSSVFPLSGRYTGFFYVNEAGQRTKIQERDVTLKFRPNNAGYHNVEGRGSNIYGKYNITGTLQKDGTINLFRHFQAVKVKASKKSTQVKISAPANGSSLLSKSKAAAAGPSAPLLTFDDVNAPDGTEPVAPLTPPDQFTAISRGILKIETDGTQTCSGSWAMTNEHYQSGLTSKYHFGIESHHAAEDAKVMLERMKSSDLAEDDDRQIKNIASDGVSPVTLANSTFPIDSTQYKGSFKMRKGATRTQTIYDHQIVLKFVKNTGGSYNVYGKGTNEMGTFDLVGTLILQGKSNGLMQLYRMYPPAPEPLPAQPAARKSGKTFPGSLTEKAPTNSGPVPAMKPPEPFVASMSGLQRRESSRVARLPSRLEEDDPQAQMDRCMDKCREILKELHDSDGQKIFIAPVDPIALGIPTYFDVIKDPMDLGTIQTKMDHNEIESPEEFARLVRLTFENAITFNTMPDNIVHICARNLLVIFNKKFGSLDKTFNAAKKNKKLTKAEKLELKRKEKEAAREAKKKEKDEKMRKRKAEAEASNESKRMKLENVISANKATMAAIAQAAPEDSNANMTRMEYNLLVQAIKQVQEQIEYLHKVVKKSPKPSTASAPSSSHADNKVKSDDAAIDASAAEPQQTSTSQPPKPKKKKPKKEVEPSPPPSPAPALAAVVEDLQPLSFEEQEALSEAINLLPERLLPGAMQIIREADFVNDDDDEIDLDIDQLDTKTQRKLQSFVMENVKTKKQRKKPVKKTKTAKAEPAPAPAPPPPPSPSPPPEEEAKPSTNLRPPGGKSFFPLDPDDDSDDDKDEDEEDLKDDFASMFANPSTQNAAKEEEDDDSDKDDEDDLWGKARREAEESKKEAAARAKREEKMRAEKEKAAQKRMAEAAALGEQARAKREEEEAARLLEEQEQERLAEEERKAARKKALEDLEGEQTVDVGDAQRKLMEQYEQEFNDNYSAGASPSSDFGF